jgi:molybdenum-dependent DNA-binding transcriptional regulator ModE
MPKAKSSETSTHTADLFDAKLLRLFDLLHHTGSVTRAAEALGLSQPVSS